MLPDSRVSCAKYRACGGWARRRPAGLMSPQKHRGCGPRGAARAVRPAEDRHDVEAQRHVLAAQVMLGEVIVRGARDSAALLGRHRLRRRHQNRLRPRPHLHERGHALAEDHQVNFAETAAVVALQDSVAPPLQISSGFPLASLARGRRFSGRSQQPARARAFSSALRAKDATCPWSLP